jgi:hypothetical protein
MAVVALRVRLLLLLQLLRCRNAVSGFIGLNTSTTQFRFNASSGSLASIVHLPRAGSGGGGTEFLTTAQQPLFSLALTRPGDHGGPLQIHALEFRRIQSIATGRESHTWLFGDHPGVFGCDGHCLALRVNCTVFTSAEDGLLHFQIAVNRTEPAHTGSWAVQGLTYPGHEQRATLDGPNDALLHPCDEGTLLRNPGLHAHNMGSSGYTSGPATPGQVARLEACAAVQFGARMTDESGLYLASQDTGGAQKQWILHTSAGQHVRWQLQHMVAEIPGKETPFLRHLHINAMILPIQARDKHRESTQKKSGVSLGANVTVAYDTVLGTFGSGGWRTAADLYLLRPILV